MNQITIPRKPIFASRKYASCFRPSPFGSPSTIYIHPFPLFVSLHLLTEAPIPHAVDDAGIHSSPASQKGHRSLTIRCFLYLFSYLSSFSLGSVSCLASWYSESWRVHRTLTTPFMSLSHLRFSFYHVLASRGSCPRKSKSTWFRILLFGARARWRSFKFPFREPWVLMVLCRSIAFLFSFR